jgi:hypothetical protein
LPLAGSICSRSLGLKAAVSLPLAVSLQAAVSLPLARST